MTTWSVFFFLLATKFVGETVCYERIGGFAPITPSFNSSQNRPFDSYTHESLHDSVFSMLSREVDKDNTGSCNFEGILITGIVQRREVDVTLLDLYDASTDTRIHVRMLAADTSGVVDLPKPAHVARPGEVFTYNVTSQTTTTSSTTTTTTTQYYLSDFEIFWSYDGPGGDEPLRVNAPNIPWLTIFEMQVELIAFPYLERKLKLTINPKLQFDHANRYEFSYNPNGETPGTTSYTGPACCTSSSYTASCESLPSDFKTS